MKKVLLNNTNIDFECVNISINQYPDNLTITIPYTYDIDYLERCFSGNDDIVFSEIDTFNTVIYSSHYHNYEIVSSITKDNNFVLDFNPITNEPEVCTVWNITLSKPDINKRLSDLENAIDEIILSMLE